MKGGTANQIFYAFFFLLQLCNLNHILGQNDITIGLFTDSMAIEGDHNLSSTFMGGVTTFSPSGSNAQLTDTTLNKALALGDVIIETNTGDIIFTPGTFEPTTVNRTLTLTSSNDAMVSLESSLLINIIVNVNGIFEVMGGGLSTGGGLINVMNASTINIFNSGLQTGAGEVVFTAVDSVHIDGAGLTTDSADVSIISPKLIVASGAVRTNGGDFIADISMGNIYVSGSGINTSSGEIDIQAVNFNKENLFGEGLSTTSSNIKLTLSGTALIEGRGILSQSGNVTVSAQKIEVKASGIETIDGDIALDIVEEVEIDGYGLSAQNGHIGIEGVSFDILNGGGVRAPNGTISLNIDRHIDISNGGVICNELMVNGGSVCIEAGGVSTTGETVIEVTDSLKIDGCGIQSLSGDGQVTLKGGSLFMDQTSIGTVNKPLELCFDGNILIDGGGVSTGTGGLSIFAKGDVVVEEGGIMTDNAPVVIHTTTDGSIRLDGCGISSGNGMGGNTVRSGGNIVEVLPDVIRPGGADIELRTDQVFQCFPTDFDIATNNKLTFGDPCSCSDTLNCTIGGVYYFHDVLRIPDTGSIASGLDIRINSSTNFYLTGSCAGGSVVSPTYGVSGTRIMETSMGSGVYEIEFWRPSGILPTLSVVETGMVTVAPASTFEPICFESECLAETIPTLNQWGILMLLLLFAVFGAVALKMKKRPYSMVEVKRID